MNQRQIKILKAQQDELLEQVTNKSVTEFANIMSAYHAIGQKIWRLENPFEPAPVLNYDVQLTPIRTPNQFNSNG